MATLACQEGQTVNGKEGVDKKKLFCKCNKKSGKCKWKNEANKKVSKDRFRIKLIFSMTEDINRLNNDDV